MTSKLGTFAFIAGLVVTLSITAFAGKKNSTKHLAVGTITSIDANQVVVTEKVKGKEQPVTFRLDSSTQKSGNLNTGTLVTIQYRTESNQNIATSIRERVSGTAAKKSLTKSSKD
jgi:hypothetical protein